jgi:hypothetical protein
MKGVPGPGAYSIKAPLEEKLAQPRGRITFGTSAKVSYMNPEMEKIPGPGQYFTSSVTPRLISKQKPFGSTTKRFEETREDSKPAVGYYDIKSDMFHTVQKKSQVYMGQPVAAFGSIGDRFIFKRPEDKPGPGAYDVSSMKKQNNSISRIQKLILHGPKIQLALVDKIHAPVFGTQQNRFDDKVVDVPPPGAYEISESFQHMKNKGHLQSGNLGNTQRQIFRIIDTPGPGTYVPIEVKKQIRRKIETIVIHCNVE